jgi:tetratricopeptide (TPR) repeat protein
VLFVPNTTVRYFGAQRDIARKRVSPKDANAALNRDIATALRASQPEGQLTVLSSPNGSVGVGYYGRFKTLGTLYWENNDGLKAAAAIFSAQSEREAATLLRAHGVTHIALISDENFIGQYYQLLHPGATMEDVKKCFGYQLMADKKVPQWLQMIPYKIPDDIASLKYTVMLFKVNFKQNLAEAIYNVAVAQMTEGSLESAERMLDILLQQAPHNYQPWLRKAELLFSRHLWIESAQHYLKGISLAPPAERPALIVAAGKQFYLGGQHGLAIDIYRTGLQEQFIPEIASYLAWILSTSQFDQLRNGPEALALIEKALKSDPNSPSFLNVFAAALAENGRFSDAVMIADRSVANARVRGQASAVTQFEQRLAMLRSGKPLRQ